MKLEKITVRFVSRSYVRHSVNGNPQYKIRFINNDGKDYELMTAKDAICGYSCQNLKLGDVVTICVNKRNNKIEYIKGGLNPWRVLVQSF